MERNTDFDDNLDKKTTGESSLNVNETPKAPEKTSEARKEEVNPEPSQPTMLEILKLLKDEREARLELEKKLLDSKKVNQLDAKAIAEIVGAIIKGNKEDNPLFLPDEPDDPEDFDEKGTPFYAFQYYLPIADDIRKGKIVFPPKSGVGPDRIIKFMPDSAKRVRNGRQHDVINICTFVSKSHKLTEWMRKDSRYNKIFFDSLPGGLTQGNASYARRMMQILSWAKELSAGALKNKCEELGIIPVMDVDVMRNNVAITMAEKEFRRDENGAWIPISFDAINHRNSTFVQGDKESLLNSMDPVEARKNNYDRPHEKVGESFDKIS